MYDKCLELRPCGNKIIKGHLLRIRRGIAKNKGEQAENNILEETITTLRGISKHYIEKHIPTAIGAQL